MITKITPHIKAVLLQWLKQGKINIIDLPEIVAGWDKWQTLGIEDEQEQEPPATGNASS